MNRRFCKLLFLCLVACISVSCSEKEDEPEYSMLFVYSSDSLGDRSFNDNIYEGMCRVYETFPEERLFIDYLLPEDYDTGFRVVEQWLKDARDRNQILVLCNVSYAHYLEDHQDLLKQTKGTVIALDYDNDSAEMYTCYLSLFGGSYLAGQVVKALGVEKAAAVLANIHNEVIVEAARGFGYGFVSMGGSFSDKDVYALSDSAGYGFSDADQLFKLSHTLDCEGYRFVFPLCGGSSQGVFRYTRLKLADYHSDPFYTCGMDVDQQEYSNRIAFSIAKRYDAVIMKIADDIMNGRTLEKHIKLGLESDYVQFVVSEKFKDMLTENESMFEQLRQNAIQAEISEFNR